MVDNAVIAVTVMAVEADAEMIAHVAMVMLAVVVVAEIATEAVVALEIVLLVVVVVDRAVQIIMRLDPKLTLLPQLITADRVRQNKH
jgi:hypothetical protein